VTDADDELHGRSQREDAVDHAPAAERQARPAIILQARGHGVAQDEGAVTSEDESMRGGSHYFYSLRPKLRALYAYLRLSFREHAPKMVIYIPDNPANVRLSILPLPSEANSSVCGIVFLSRPLPKVPFMRACRALFTCRREIVTRKKV
jgi:hypothetical protein